MTTGIRRTVGSDSAVLHRYVAGEGNRTPTVTRASQATSLVQPSDVLHRYLAGQPIALTRTTPALALGSA